MTWVIIGVVAFILIGVFLFRRQAVVVSKGPSTGEQLRKAAENIPIYGTFVKAAGVVGKPVNNALDKWTGYHVKALQHIPVVGSTIAKPVEWTQQGVKKLNNWLGL